MLRKIVYFFIIQYRKISAILPARCRFYPSCSVYALCCLENKNLSTKHSLVLIFKRLIKCHPFHQGGVDEAPLFYKEKNVQKFKI